MAKSIVKEHQEAQKRIEIEHDKQTALSEGKDLKEVKDHIPPGSRSEAKPVKVVKQVSPWQKVHVTKEIRIQTPDMTSLLTISISPKGTVSLKTPNSASKVITPKQLDELIAGTEVAKMLALSAPNKKD